MNYGFVTSLPRSGTAWLANYLSYGNCAFLHDPWMKFTPNSLKDFLDKSALYAGGSVDCGNLFFLDELNKAFTDAKWVVITRPMSEVQESCKAINFPLADFTGKLRTLMDGRNVLKVPFAELFDRADEIGRYLYDDFSSPAWRLEALKPLNVQLNWNGVSKQFRVPESLKQIEPLTSDKIRYFDLVNDICNKDEYATRFLTQARNASELYRQLDQGKPVDIQKAKDTLEAMATEWIASPFVRSYFATLAPAIVSALEKYRANDTSHCPVDIELLTAVTYILKGNDGVKEFMPKVREISDKILKEKS